MAEKQKNVWVLADDRAGNRAQCLGVAEALGVPFTVKEIGYRAMAGLPNIVLGASFAGVARKDRSGLSAPWPDLVIGAGRRTAPVARRIKALSGGRTVLAQIMDPKVGRRDFGLIAMPAHDAASAGRPGRAANVLVVPAAPHRLTEETLADAASRWRDAVTGMPTPWIAVLIGGSTRRRVFSDTMALDFASQLASMVAVHGGSLLVTTSRRTPETAVATLRRAFQDSDTPHLFYAWGDASHARTPDGGNPYLGFLGLADAIVVTGESVSMCSEACGTGAPAYIYAPEALTTAKHARLHQALYAAGGARPFDGSVTSWSPTRVNVADLIADAIRDRFALG